MANVWLGGVHVTSQPHRVHGKAPIQSMQMDMKDLKHHVQRLSLMNQALWELIRSKLGLTDEELLQMAHEVDLRDGVEDGRITDTALQCPSCGRVSSSKHWKCLYCGQEFEKPVMG